MGGVEKTFVVPIGAGTNKIVERMTYTIWPHPTLSIKFAPTRHFKVATSRGFIFDSEDYDDSHPFLSLNPYFSSN